MCSESLGALCDKQLPTLRPPSLQQHLWGTAGEQATKSAGALSFLTIFRGDKGSQAWTPTFKQAPSGTKVPRGNYNLSESKNELKEFGKIDWWKGYDDTLKISHQDKGRHDTELGWRVKRQLLEQAKGNAALPISTLF